MNWELYHCLPDFKTKHYQALPQGQAEDLIRAFAEEVRCSICDDNPERRVISNLHILEDVLKKYEVHDESVNQSKQE